MAKDQKKKTVREYLDSLVWDGQPRLSRWLSDYAGAEDTPRHRAISRAALVAAVRRARYPSCKIDEMLILEAPQGVGKSAALRVLAIDEDWFTDDFPIADESALVEATAGKWIVEASELSGMSSGDAAALKACLSRQHDVSRRAPYQREGTKVPRGFVIVGTTSETDYLRDPTGNRRFWAVRATRFDLDRLRADRGQLWAEAAVAEAVGEPTTIEDGDTPRIHQTPFPATQRLIAELGHAAREQLARTDSTDGHLHADHLARLILAFLGEK
jgi:predicted P-loop ATPase